MLNTIDTVIAFAVVMTILSLLITILVQMLSAALSLRGKNLANALALTFQTIDPKSAEHAHALAGQILSDPIFSDSIWAAKTRLPGQSKNRHLRILAKAQREIITLTQDLMDNAQDDSKKQKLAQAQGRAQAAWAALQIPARSRPWKFFSFRGMHLGSAIRPGEVYRILHDYSALAPADAVSRGIAPLLVQVSQSLLTTLKNPDQPAAESKDKLRALVDVANLFNRDAQKQAVVDSLADLGATVERATTQAYDRFQRWFGSAQDRAEQWFQINTRGATVFFAVLGAVFLQLDTVEIFHKLRDRPGLVEALVKSAPAVVAQGGKVIVPASAGLPNPPSEETQKLREDMLKDLQGKLTETGFELVPKSFLGRWDEKADEIPGWARKNYPRVGHMFVHLLGMLMTIGLLALGAPFWFNLLKNLMNLRPAMAQLIERRPQSAPALPASPAQPPATS